jgi:ribosome-binding factor A
MTTQRPERVSEALRCEISRIVHEELKDPRLGFLTITKVELTKDLRYARVYFSVLGEPKEKELALKGLKSAKGYIKNLVSEKVKLRFMPEFEFRIDNSAEQMKNIQDVLDKIKKESADGKGDRSDKAA